MKKLVLATLALTCAVGVYAQGTVTFNNRITGVLVTRVYAMNPANPTQSVIGNGSTDTPAGAVNWTGWTALSGSAYRAILMSAPGANAADGALAFAGTPTTFRTGTAAGQVAAQTVTLPNVGKDAAVATIQMFAWDNTSGNYADATAAWTAWQGGLISAGVSGKLNINSIGGDLNTPPNLTGLQSFNLYLIPEPSTLALAGLGAAALLIFRRRN